MNKKLTLLEEFECIIVDLVPLAKEANKESIKAVEKALKAFDLLIKKLDMETLLHWLKEHSTEEEFDLLKEVLL